MSKIVDQEFSKKILPYDFSPESISLEVTEFRS